MFLTLFNKRLLWLFAAILTSFGLLFLSCQKELSSEGIDLGITAPDLSTKINTTVQGFVIDENDQPVQGAAVQAGSLSAVTDKYGYFRISNASLVQNAAVLAVLKPGYFKAVKTFIASTNHQTLLRIKLLAKNTAGTVSATAGGSCTLGNGLMISLPANGVVNASTNSAYTGTVSIAAQWLNPQATDINQIMPGDLRGLNTAGQLKLLQTYGMAAVELTGAAGEKLQVANGKKATIHFPLPAALQASAPASIPLWYFDEVSGLWKEEGSASKNGSTYVAEVSHFSYWNCDMPLQESVQFTATIVNSAGQPVIGASVGFKYANGMYTGAHGYTDSSGYVVGTIPANAQLIIEVFAGYVCNEPSFSQNITTGTTNLALGNLTVGSSQIAAVNGKVVNCSGAAVSNGYVLIRNGFTYHRISVNTDGSFNGQLIACNTMAVAIFAIDEAMQQQSLVIETLLQMGMNDLGTLQACGISAEHFIRYTLDGVQSGFSSPTDDFFQSMGRDSTGQNALDVINIRGFNGVTEKMIAFGFASQDAAQGSTQALKQLQIQPPGTELAVLQSSGVNITEFGAVGQFIAGNFSATVKEANAPNTQHTITCSFRVRRLE
ncbi:MAG: hypothetical protein RL172_410 [Bacteroidota bacterium]|jgi:hypothetical protein